MEQSKEEVRKFWDRSACEEELYLPSITQDGYAAQAAQRYSNEPYILPFADFQRWKGKRVLEIGVGLGADHQKFAEAGAELWGVDLTERAISHTARRLAMLDLKSNLQVGDSENLSFPDNQFDLVYSWGVIHHSPDTQQAAREIMRVLRPGGELRVMIYHKYSMIGIMLWLRYALLTGRLFTTLDSLYARYLESPGTKAYTQKEGMRLFPGAEGLRAEIKLSQGDLLENDAGQRHRGLALSVAQKIWPRRLIKTSLPWAGLFMLISGRKPMDAS